MCVGEAPVCSCVYEIIEAGCGPEEPKRSPRTLDKTRSEMWVGDVLIFGNPHGADGYDIWEVIHLTPEYAYYEAQEVSPWSQPCDNTVGRFRRDDLPIRALGIYGYHTGELGPGRMITDHLI